MENIRIAHINRLIIISALIILVGAMLSGPVSTGLLMLFKPQPKWYDVETFMQNYHWIQSIPFILGYILMLGSCMFIAASARLAKEEMPKIMCNLALISIAVYSALISLNYVIQAAYVPDAGRNQPRFCRLSYYDQSLFLMLGNRDVRLFFSGGSFLAAIPGL